jgi:predicted enzyme related to lactoylglutathione lyase
VDDADAAVARAVALGGAVLSPPLDMPYGRHADIADPNGAPITVIAMATPPTD